MTLPCPQPGGLPTGRALQPGEEGDKGPAAPPGSICGSQAIASEESTSPAQGCGSYRGSFFTCLQNIAKRELQAWAWQAGLGSPRPKSSQGLAEPPQSLSADFGLSGYAEEHSQREGGGTKTLPDLK